MQPYSWSCLACGTSNAASATACSRCECPARATVAEIECCRGSYEAPVGTTVAPRLSEPFPWPSVHGIFPVALGMLVAWLLFTRFSAVSVVLIYAVAWLGAGWLRQRLVDRPVARAAVRAAPFALMLSPGIITGHGVMIAPASVGVFYVPLPNLVSLATCYAIAFSLCVRAEKPSEQSARNGAAIGGAHEA